MTIKATFLARLRHSLAKLLIPGVLDRLASQQVQIDCLETKIRDEILVALECVDNEFQNVEAGVRAEIIALRAQLIALEAELLRCLPAADPARGEG